LLLFFISELKEESGEWHSYAAQEGELTEAAGGGELLVAPCHMTTVLVPGFRIRINLIRIRIQHFRLNTDPDLNPIRIQEFNGQKFKKIYS
jgi:hypothetical protein